MSFGSSAKDLIRSKVYPKVGNAYPSYAGSLAAIGPPILLEVNHK
jgi:hypothetical protein